MASSNVQSPAQSHAFDGVQQLLIVIAALCTISISGWVLLQPPAQQYEVMYDAYPTAVWALIATGFGASALVVLVSALRGDGYWKLALAFVCVIYCLYTFLPLFRGWALYGRGEADVLTHVGYTKVILESAHFPAWDFYPGFHGLLAEFTLVGFEIRAAHALFSAVFMLAYIFGLFLLAKQLSGRKRVAVVTLFVAILPLYERFHHTFHPAMFAFFLVPTFLFCFEKYRTTNQTGYLAYGMLLSFILVISHPMTSLYAIVMLVVAIVTRYLYSYLFDQPLEWARGISILGFMTATWIVWFSQFDLVRRAVLIAVGIEATEGPTGVETFGTQEVARAPTLQDIVIPFVQRYGPILLIGTLAALTTVVIVSRLWQYRASLADSWLATQFWVGAVIGLVALFTFTNVLEFEPIRNARYAILMGTLLVGVFLWWGLRTQRFHRRIGVLLVVVLLLLAFPVAVTNTYYPHMHLTHTEEDGTEWMYDHRTADTRAVSHHVTEGMRMYIRGGSYEESVFDDIGGDSPMPQHFGYETNETVGQAVNGERLYLVTKEYDTTFYTVIKEYLRAENIAYTETDRQRLRMDPTAERIYSNGGYTVWVINEGSPPNGTSNASADLRSPRTLPGP